MTVMTRTNGGEDRQGPVLWLRGDRDRDNKKREKANQKQQHEIIVTNDDGAVKSIRGRFRS
jgi:hypothetical protein